MFHEIVHLAKTYCISMQFLKKNETYFIQYFIYTFIVYFLFINLALFI